MAERLLDGVDESEPLMILTLAIPDTDTEITGVVHQVDLDKPISEIYNVVKDIHEAAQKLKKFTKAKPKPPAPVLRNQVAPVQRSPIVLATEDDVPELEDDQSPASIKQFVGRQPKQQGDASSGGTFRPTGGVRNIVVSKNGAQKQDGRIIAPGQDNGDGGDGGDGEQDESWNDIDDPRPLSKYQDTDDVDGHADQEDLPPPPPSPRRGSKPPKIDANKNVSVEDIRRKINPKTLLQETESLQGVMPVQIPRRVVDEFGQTDITIAKFDDSKLQARIRRDPNFSRGNQDD